MRAALGLPILLLLLISCSRVVVNTPVWEQSPQGADSLEQQFEQDNQGLLYRAMAVDDRLKLTELITKQSLSGQLLIRWTLLNAEPQYPVDEVYVNVTILDKSSQVTENWTTRASANVSDDLFYLDIQSKTTVTYVGGYVLEWRGLPERESYDAPQIVQKPSALGLKDDLGITYVLEFSDNRFELSRVEAIKNEQGSLEISGELANADSSTGIAEAAVTIKLYEEMGQNIGGFSVLARSDTDAGGLKFRLDTGLPVERVKRYSLQWKGPV